MCVTKNIKNIYSIYWGGVRCLTGIGGGKPYMIQRRLGIVNAIVLCQGLYTALLYLNKASACLRLTKLSLHIMGCGQLRLIMRYGYQAGRGLKN